MTDASCTTPPCQGPHLTRDSLAAAYGLEKSQVHVITPDVGGGFGAKSRTYPEELALGFYARAVGRPVRWTETRSENMMAMPHGRSQVQHARMGQHPATATLTAYQLDVVQDAGAFPLTGADPAHGSDDADGRPACYPHPQRRVHRRVGRHQHVVDHHLSRRRTTGGSRRHRAHDRPVRRRDRDGSGRRQAAQPSAQVPRAVHDRHRHRVRRRRLPGGAGAGAFTAATTSSAPSSRAVGPTASKSSWASASRSTSRSQPAGRRPSSAGGRSRR